MSTMTLGRVSLRVNDLVKQKNFYQEVIGLHIIEETSQKVELGIKETSEVLVSLVTSSKEYQFEKTTGLYHLALLLPSRVALSGFLRHLIEIKAPLIGAADHGYSEAIYLEDLEGNGIEIYADKPLDKWDIQTDGKIKGVTLELDAEDLFSLTDQSIEKMPIGTKMGHVHLSVADFKANEQFYGETLNFQLTDDLGGHARFFSVDGYHHHIGVNNWQGIGIKKREDHHLGLDYYQMMWEKESFEQLKAHLKQQEVAFFEVNDQEFHLVDPNGILIQMHVN
ncbi:VOC family protein [Vagococcus carniphilus]|uniref:VOC family protein n=1 Tax=Vagococcus carniphilus TaxID=218144 RepID=A0AAW8UBI8_9ENTE|nr:VOC family protein [Vagococcus carniphilus]MDT2834617.1 VOC family protein [Vagococcus carniphilus]